MVGDSYSILIAIFGPPTFLLLNRTRESERGGLPREDTAASLLAIALIFRQQLIDVIRPIPFWFGNARQARFVSASRRHELLRRHRHSFLLHRRRYDFQAAVLTQSHTDYLTVAHRP